MPGRSLESQVTKVLLNRNQRRRSRRKRTKMRWIPQSWLNASERRKSVEEMCSFSAKANIT